MATLQKGGAESDPVASPVVAAETAARVAAITAEEGARKAADASEKSAREGGEVVLAAAAAAAKTTADAALPKAGGTMVGDIVLKGDPLANLNPATKQWVEARIAAVINGAPGALDTLKEIADKLGSDESAVEALTSTVAGKLAAAKNLEDLVNVVTARTNLGLGSAATHPAGDFDAAGAAAAAQAAAIAASQPLDPDLTTLAGITSTAMGQTLLAAASAAAARTAIETNSMAQFDALERRGLLEKEHFGLSTPTGVTTFAVVANAMRATRFVPLRDMVVRGLSWVVSVAASVDDPCAIAMLDTNGKTKLASSGSVSGKMNATGRKDVDFTADVSLTAGHVYYPAHQNSTIGGTAATVMAWSLANAFMSAIIGEGSGNFLGEGGTPTFPFATEPAPTSQGTPTLLIVRER